MMLTAGAGAGANPRLARAKSAAVKRGRMPMRRRSGLRRHPTSRGAKSAAERGIPVLVKEGLRPSRRGSPGN
jgi:hypothetical protein